ncbi:unnamed protein product [Urochloa decumbens]|uniref:AAA+ ATPase domain-containing protein n=1 Tax=Urochloa decumbens TaxID=240449 RepID=A0ABC9F1N3_9POAL
MEDGGGDPKNVVRLLERSLLRSRQRAQHGELEGHRSSDLEELRTSIMDASADDYYPTLTHKFLRKELMDLSYDVEDYMEKMAQGRWWYPPLLRIRWSLTRQHEELASRLQDAKKIWESSNQQPAALVVEPMAELCPAGEQEEQRRLDSCSAVEDCVDDGHLEKSVGKLQDLKAEAMNKLASMLAFDTEHEQQLKVVPIFGPARVGKTSLARTMYRYYGGRFHRRAFLRVSRNPDTRRLLADLLSQIKGRQPERLDVYELIHKIKQLLYGKSYFVIIDDLWSTSVWDLIRQAFPEGNCSSRIIATTQIEDIALYCSGYCKDNIYDMLARHSGDHQSQKLFILTYERGKEVINLSYNKLPTHLKKCLLYLKMYPEDYVMRKDDLVKQWVAEGFVVAGTENIWKVAADYFDDLITRGMIQPLGTSYNGEVLSCTVDQMVFNLISERSEDENFVTVVNGSETNALLSHKVRRLSVNFGGSTSARIPDSFRISQVRSLMFSGFFKCVPSIVEYSLLRVLILHIWTDQDKMTFDLTWINKLFHLRYLKIDCNMTVKLPAKIWQLQYLETLEIYARVAAVPSDIFLLKHLIYLHLPIEICLHHWTMPYVDTGVLVSSLLHTVGNINRRSTNTAQTSTNTAQTSINIAQTSTTTAGFESSLLHPILKCVIGQLHWITFRTSLCSLGNFNISTASRYSVFILQKLTNLQDLHLSCSGVPDKRLSRNMDYLASILGKFSNLKSLILDGGISSSKAILYDGLNSIKLPPDCFNRLDLSPRVLILSSLGGLVGQLRNLCTLKIAVKELSSADVHILKSLCALTALSLYVRTAPEARIQFNKDEFPVLKYFKFICAAPCLEFKKEAMQMVQLVKLGFNANRIQLYDPIDAGFENLTHLQVITAKIGGSDADEASQVVAITMHVLQNAFRDHASPPVINIKLVNSSFDGDIERSYADSMTRKGQDEHGIRENDSTEDFDKLANSRITMSSESSSHMLNRGWESWKPKDHSRLTETVRGLSYMTSKRMKREGLGVNNQIASTKLEMKLMQAVLDSSPGALPDEWVLQLQDLSYEVEDFVDIYSWLHINKSWSHLLAHIRHAVHLTEKVRSLREWQHSCASRGTAAGSDGQLPFVFYNSDDKLFGIGKQKAKLRELMPSISEGVRVITIVGCPGVGKTALARAVYQDCSKSKLFGSFVWVTASGCNSSGDLINRFIQQLKETPSDIAADIYSGLKEVLCKSPFLVVIDDLQESKLWYDIQSVFAGNHTGTTVIITTSRQSVAATNRHGKYIYRMRGLDSKDSRKLFWTTVGSRASCTPALEYALGDTLSKCGGLPLALISAAKYLHRSGQHPLPGAPGVFTEMNRVLITQLYDSLPNNGHRMCLLSLSTFPYGHLIKRKRVIRRWIAERLAVGDGVLSAEQVADKRFDELVDRNIVEPVQICNNSKVKGFLVHGVFMDFIVDQSVSKEFATLICRDQLLTNKSGARPVRRLYVQEGTTESGRVASAIGLDRVRSLTIYNTVPFDFLDCWLLRVLDLEGCEQVDSRVLQSLCKLIFLKYLSLRGSDVDRIPSEIEKLESLETLDIRETEVKALPVQVFLLPRLAYLFGQFELPREIGDSTRNELRAFFLEKSRLQTLSGFVMVDNDGFEPIVLHIRSLRKVTIWCKYSVTSSLSGSDNLASSLQKRFAGNNALESLSINIGDESSSNFLDFIEAPCMLSSIKLRGKLSSLPSFITSYDTTLSELQLSSTGLSFQALSQLQNLRRLLYLKLVEDREALKGDCFIVRGDGFPSLQRLCFVTPKLPAHVEIHKGGMGCLTSLHLLCPEYAGYSKFERPDDLENRFEGRINSEKGFKGFKRLYNLREVVLHPYVAEKEMYAWTEKAKSHANRPKVRKDVII